MALKCADICNPCRPWELSKHWSEKVCKEFFQQGFPPFSLNRPRHTPQFIRGRWIL